VANDAIADAPVVPAVPAACKSVNGHFNIVARAGHASMKVKGDFDEAATARLIDTTEAATARLIDTTEAATAWTPKRWAESVAMAATPFILGGLGGLAIWRMTGQRAFKMPSAVCDLHVWGRG